MPPPRKEGPWALVAFVVVRHFFQAMRGCSGGGGGEAGVHLSLSS